MSKSISKKAKELLHTTTPRGRKVTVEDADSTGQKTPHAIRTMFNAVNLPRYREVNTMPSLTLPDQSLSIQQIMEKHRRGYPIDARREPQYLGDEYVPDIKHLDLAEQAEILHEARETVRQTEKNIQEQVWRDREKKAADAQAALLKKMEENLKKSKEQNPENKVSEP